jgi:RimJ/RimL family protein N-acetyltransferase
MAEFFITLSSFEMAQQIANLLNIQNKLYKHHTAHTVMSTATDYFVEVEGGAVIGCSGLVKEHPTLSKSYHTSVHPSYQGRGLGSKLLKTAMANCNTPYIYGTIREDNPASLRLVSKLGWKYIRKDWSHDHFVITMASLV